MSKLAQEMQRLADEIFKKKTPPTRDEVKAVKKRTQADVIAAVRAEVFRLDKACVCGRCLPARTDAMHELVPRSQTRGLPPEQRFNAKLCIRLSRRCHAAVTGELKHGKRLTITILDAQLGANGPLQLSWKGGKTVTYVRHSLRR